MSLYHHATVIAVKYPKQKVVVVAGDGIRNSSTTCCEKQRAVNALPPGWHVIYVDCDTYGKRLESVAGLRICHDDMKRALHDKTKLVVESRRGASQAIAFERIWSPMRCRCDELAEMLNRKPCERSQFFTSDQMAEIDNSAKLYKAFRDRIETRHRERLLERRRREEKRLAELAKTETEDAVLWRRHEYSGDRNYWFGTYLRLSHSGAHVETSKGVVVTFADALRLFRVCRAAKTRNEAVPAAVISDMSAIGGYRVVEIEATGDAVVGCHHLKYEEMAQCFETAEQRKLVQAEEIEREVRA